MPEQETIKRAQKDKRQGKSPTTQAGEFVREEIHHIREGKHGARSAKQAIAIGLSKARRAGVKLPPPKKGEASEKTRESAERAYERGQGAPAKSKSSPKRKRAITRALKREGTSAASKKALSTQAKRAAKRRTASERSTAAKKAARTKGGRGTPSGGKKGGSHSSAGSLTLGSQSAWWSSTSGKSFGRTATRQQVDRLPGFG
jgi:hypothetical protein